MPQAAELTERLARRTGAVIALSGATDIVSDGHRTLLLHNGAPTMARITGSGCMLAALTGAFAEHRRNIPLRPQPQPRPPSGVAGSWPRRTACASGAGNASFRTHLIDGVFRLHRNPN
ncbi:MAG: hydroxyethylthiazole kinase [Oscillospiraceae bacterium]